MKKILSYLGSYFNSSEFDLDIAKIADISEMTEEEVEKELNELQTKGNIKLNNGKVTLINIKPRKNEEFNNLYAPIETITWSKGMKLVLDK